ncbi:MAG: 4-hydroxybenzoate polyprenyltransferase [Rhodothermales bacterium]|jgi:4-hydroxybenzoate polyprenyltransferase
MVDWFRFLRWPNLLIIAISMILVRYAVIEPALAVPGAFAVSLVGFAGLVLSTVLMAAAGNVANDIADQEIDTLNKPDRVFVGRIVSATGAAKLGLGLTIGAALVLIPPVRQIGFEPWLLLYPLAALLLLGYAYGLECMPIVGNTLVSFLASVVPLLVLFAEQPALNTAFLGATGTILWAYASFAFLASMFRELVKDLQDAPGDGACGCNTLAVRSVPAARGLAFIVLGLLVLGLLAFLVGLGSGPVAWAASVGLVGAPLIAAARSLFRAREPLEYGRVSLFAKMIMLGGLVLLPFLVA